MAAGAKERDKTLTQPSQAPMMDGGFFSSDRAKKYGWGIPRLFLLLLLAFELAPRLSVRVRGQEALERASNRLWSCPCLRLFEPICPSSMALTFVSLQAGVQDAAALGLLPYLTSGRLLGHAYIGSIGAVVNVQLHGLAVNLVLLTVAAGFILWDLRLDYTILVYMTKTFSGDFIAGKLDSTEWRLVLLFTSAVGGIAWWVEQHRDAAEYGGMALPAALSQYTRILPLLAVIQLVCELGDNHLEHHAVVGTFFRHRYSFELLSGALLTANLALSPAELAVVQHDLVICWFYRVSNGLIIMSKSGAAMLHFRRLAFRAFGALRGMRLVVVSDVETALAVLRSSSCKGNALENLVASPAWDPVLSLESIDGLLYQAMIADLHLLIAALPSPGTLQDIARDRLESMLAEASAAGNIIDADAIALWSVGSFVRFLFGSGPERQAPPARLTAAEEAAAVRCLVEGSWEWRKEIAVILFFALYQLDRSVYAWDWRREIAVRGAACSRHDFYVSIHSSIYKYPSIHSSIDLWIQVRGPACAQRKTAALQALMRLLEGSALWELHGEKWREARYYSLVMQPFLLSPAINLGDVAVAMHSNPTMTPEQAMRAAHPFPILERFVGAGGARLRDGTLVVQPNTQVVM